MPMFLGGRTARFTANINLANQLIASHSIMVVYQELHLNIVQAFFGWNVKYKTFIENWTQGAFLYVGSFFKDSLVVVEYIDFYVWV